MSEKEINLIPKELGKFIEKLFIPSAEEIGLIFSERLKLYRFKNQVQVMKKTQEYCDQNNIKPIESIGFAFKFWENASLADKDEVQDRWASLLANAANKSSSSNEEHYELCVNILKQMTVIEVSTLDSIVKTLQGFHEISRTMGNRFGCEGRNVIGMRSLARMGLIESDPLRDLNELTKLNTLSDKIDEQREKSYGFDNRLYSTQNKRYFLTDLGELFVHIVYTGSQLMNMTPEFYEARKYNSFT